MIELLNGAALGLLVALALESILARRREEAEWDSAARRTWRDRHVL